MWACTWEGSPRALGWDVRGVGEVEGPGFSGGGVYLGPCLGGLGLFWGLGLGRLSTDKPSVRQSPSEPMTLSTAQASEVDADISWGFPTGRR